MKFRAPNAFVLIASIMVAMMVATWFIPGGRYGREVREFEGYGSKEIVLPEQFESVESVPQTPFDLLLAPMKGAEQAAETLAFVLLIGGAFGVLMHTGALMAGLKWLTLRAKGAGRYLVIPVLMFAFSFAGVLFGMAEECLVFVLLTVPLAISLGFDATTGVAIPFIGSQAGFATAFVNPFSFGIAKQIAEQPTDVGFGYRVFCWLLITGVCVAIVMWHARRVALDPANSLTPAADANWRRRLAAESGEEPDADSVITPSQIVTLVVFGLMMIVLGYGSIALGWYVMEIAAVFLAMALFCGLAARLSLNAIADSFMAGARELCATAVLVAFSRAIVVLAEDANIIDTILHSVATRIDHLGPDLGVFVMYSFQSCLNFLIPSGSGQAALTMPIMTPLSDLLGIHRESAILAFQFGDGFTNMIIPTSVILVGVLSSAGIGYGTWFKWWAKWQLLLFALGAVLLYAAPWN